MNFMKDVYEGKQNQLVHNQFRRFSKGNFDNRALMQINKVSKKLKLRTSFEFVEGFIRFLSEKLGDEKTKVTGGIISAIDFGDELGFEPEKIKNFQGIKTILVSGEMSGNKILTLMEKYPNSVWLLSMKIDGYELKSKVKTPKSGKAGKKDEAPKADFCTFSADGHDLIPEFLFDIDEEFKKVMIIHEFVIDKIEVPEEYKDDFAKAREYALKVGKVIRKIDLDGKAIVKEFPLKG
jgi:hypothetical protein